MSTIYSWLISTPLSSHENSLARLVVSGLNWGVREADVTGQQVEGGGGGRGWKLVGGYG